MNQVSSPDYQTFSCKLMTPIFRTITSCFLLIAANLVQAAGSLTVSTLPDPDPATTLAGRILTQAYAEMGITLQIKAMPGERSLVSANSGSTDGELYRKQGINTPYPNLLMVPVPLMKYEIVAFSHDDTITLQGWDSLRPYRFGFVKGVKIIEDKTQGMQGEPVGTLRQAFDMLSHGRFELLIANRISGMAMQKQLWLSQFAPLSPPLESFPVYHYLNSKHQKLLPKLTDILRRMEKNGDIARIQRDVLLSF